MAEYVHQTLEEMIPELEEMNRIGLFSVKETKIILKNRENYEYKLRQMTKTKPMFLNYIEYEKKLLELLKIRRKKLGQVSKKRDIEKSIADRIHKLYRLVTTRFSEDVSLWEQHIEFSKHLNEKAYVTRLYNQALKLHSHNEDLLVKSAQWESSREGNSNSELAREILLRGQRVNPESEVILLQMFQMELELATQILKRKVILCSSSSQADEEEEMSEMKLAEIVYRKGVEMFPGNSELHLKLLHICCQHKRVQPLQRIIVADLQHIYPNIPLVWNALALCHLNHLKNMSSAFAKTAVSQCLSLFCQAVEKVPTEEMWSFCLNGHLNVLRLREAKVSEQTLKSTLELFEKAIGLGTLSEDLYLNLLELLADVGATIDVEKVAVRGTEQHPTSARLWLARLQASRETGEGLRKLLMTGLRRVAAEWSWPLWQFVLNKLAMTHEPVLEQLMETACRSVTPQVCLPAKEWSLHWTFKQGGLKSARRVYSSLKTMRPTKLNLCRLYVQIECAQVEPNLKLIRAAFEEALVEFGQSEAELWLNYMEMEKLVAQDMTRAGVIQQRALRSLEPHLKESLIRKMVMVGLGA